MNTKMRYEEVAKIGKFFEDSEELLMKMAKHVWSRYDREDKLTSFVNFVFKEWEKKRINIGDDMVLDIDPKRKYKIRIEDNRRFKNHYKIGRDSYFANLVINELMNSMENGKYGEELEILFLLFTLYELSGMSTIKVLYDGNREKILGRKIVLDKERILRYFFDFMVKRLKVNTGIGYSFGVEVYCFLSDKDEKNMCFDMINLIRKEINHEKNGFVITYKDGIEIYGNKELVKKGFEKIGECIDKLYKKETIEMLKKKLDEWAYMEKLSRDFSGLI